MEIEFHNYLLKNFNYKIDYDFHKKFRVFRNYLREVDTHGLVLEN